MFTRLTGLTFAVLVVIVPARPSAAQAPRVEASGGYQATHTPDQTLPLAWTADVAIILTDAWSAVGEVSGAYRSVADSDLGTDVKLRLHTLAGGGRWSPSRTWRISPFVQLLVGAERARANAPILQTELGDARTSFMLQPGGGVTLNTTRSIGIIGQVDYRRVFLDDEEDEGSGENQFRIAVGLRVGF